MGLYEEYLLSIKEGKKIFEMRLNDEKRRKIKVGDKVEFVKIPEKNEILSVEVSVIHLKKCMKIFPFKNLIVKVGQSKIW
ncbi:ASCH domain-containing protein [Chengkuizengella sp. SCS-71B]|uniref:ASCH domain-containing protein n=1 Tax=Chengkuizengella sp. SCS-71B TaxID=3115290 RepID=UPI0032C21F6A